MSQKLLFLIIFNILLLIILSKLFFKTIRNTLYAFIYFLIPGDLFLLTKHWDKSFKDGHKFLFFVLLLLLIMLLEYKLFY